MPTAKSFPVAHFGVVGEGAALHQDPGLASRVLGVQLTRVEAQIAAASAIADSGRSRPVTLSQLISRGS
jgi:hypothetical protein